MMEPPQSESKIVAWVSLLIYAYAVWIFSQSSSGKYEDVKVWWYLSKGCKGIASLFGKWAIAAELKYHETAEKRYL